MSTWVVCVAEKPSISQTLAAILSDGTASCMRKTVPVYEVRHPIARMRNCCHPETALPCLAPSPLVPHQYLLCIGNMLIVFAQFPGKFEGRHVNYRVTSVAGHVFSTDFPEEYQSWDAVDPVDLFALPVVKVGRGQCGCLRWTLLCRGGSRAWCLAVHLAGLCQR